ncbi:MAG: response regulator [Spirochaetes bacterium]|nr:response regulator [Spirochaetota bacterium]
MVKDKILIADGSELIKNFLKEKLESYNFEVIVAKEALDLLIKMKNYRPDITIIDYPIVLNTDVDFFDEKNNYKTTQNIPVIMLGRNIEADKTSGTSKYKIYKLLSKPIKIEILLKTIEEILKKDLNIDDTECIIDIHLNDDILFIEVAEGLNREKIDSLKYKILEIKELYGIDNPKILIMLIDMNLKNVEENKLINFINSITKYGNSRIDAIKILTSNTEIYDILKKYDKYSSIEVTNDISVAMDSLSDINIGELLNRGFRYKEEQIKLSYSDKTLTENSEFKRKKFKIFVTDDDSDVLLLVKSILTASFSWEVVLFNNARDMIDSLSSAKPDLLFLDLMMPKMSGLETLEYFKQNNIKIPVIVFSALSQKETVQKTLSYGVKSYIVKPISPQIIINKAIEVLKLNF